MVLRLYACDVRSYGKNAHNSRGDIYAEINEKENGAHRAAAVSAYFYMERFVYEKNEYARNEIFKSYEPYARRGRGKYIDNKAEKIACYGKNHGKRTLAASALIFEMRYKFLKRVSGKWQNGEEQKHIGKVPERGENLGVKNSNC